MLLAAVPVDSMNYNMNYSRGPALCLTAHRCLRLSADSCCFALSLPACIAIHMQRKRKRYLCAHPYQVMHQVASENCLSLLPLTSPPLALSGDGGAMFVRTNSDARSSSLAARSSAYQQRGSNSSSLAALAATPMSRAMSTEVPRSSLGRFDQLARGGSAMLMSPSRSGALGSSDSMRMSPACSGGMGSGACPIFREGASCMGRVRMYVW